LYITFLLDLLQQSKPEWENTYFRCFTLIVMFNITTVFSHLPIFHHLWKVFVVSNFYTKFKYFLKTKFLHFILHLSFSTFTYFIKILHFVNYSKFRCSLTVKKWRILKFVIIYVFLLTQIYAKMLLSFIVVLYLHTT
jgi:hypothetical protein